MEQSGRWVGGIRLQCHPMGGEGSPQIDYWVTAADTPAEIMRHYVDVTGHAPILPEFASGFWQTKLRYEPRIKFWR